MHIRWLGHACFLITTDSGVKIVTDPFNEEIGYKTPSEQADIVTVSHEHGDHNYVEGLRGNYLVIKEQGPQEHLGVKINGVPTFHDESAGSKRGGNMVYTFEADGIKLCHCGDLGHILSAEQRELIGRVDILMIPVGEFFTLGVDKALHVIRQLDPQTVIPMHYRSPYLTGYISTVLSTADKFISAAGMPASYADELDVRADSIGRNKGVIMFNYDN